MSIKFYMSKEDLITLYLANFKKGNSEIKKRDDGSKFLAIKGYLSKVEHPDGTEHDVTGRNMKATFTLNGAENVLKGFQSKYCKQGNSLRFKVGAVGYTNKMDDGSNWYNFTASTIEIAPERTIEVILNDEFITYREGLRIIKHLEDTGYKAEYKNSIIYVYENGEQVDTICDLSEAKQYDYRSKSMDPK